MPERKYKLKNLLEDTNICYYWIGYLLADGCISGNRLSLTSKDYIVLKNFCEYLDIDLSYIQKRTIKSNDYYTVSVMDTENIPKILEKFNWKNNKTYNPPNPLNIGLQFKHSLAIGFIDGDGSINYRHKGSSCHILIRCHKSWLNFLSWLYSSAHINNSGYAEAYVSNNSDIKFYKKFAIDNNLPILKRKWDKVDLDFTSKQEIGKIRICQVKELLEKGLSRKDIANILGITASGVTMIIRRNIKCT